MKTRTAVLLCFIVLASCVMPTAASAMDQIQFAPVQRAYLVPGLGQKQGWLSITNRDWQDYYLEVVDQDKMFLYRGQVIGRRGIQIHSGATITIAIEKDSYDLYGETSDRLRVRVREGRTTTLALEPFGYHRNSGLVGIVNDGDRVRKETLFDTYSSPVIVPAPPPVVIERPAPPPVIIQRPPVVVQRPPVVVQQPPVVVVPSHRPPPPPPPRRNDGWGFFFGMDSGRRR